MNQVGLIGNLVKDAELKALPGTDGRMVLEFTVAWDERYKTAEGGWDERPQYVDCSVYGPYGEKLAPYMTKGLRVGVEARLKHRTWKSDDGATHSKHSLEVYHIDLLSAKNDKPEPDEDE
jgi:single-strand DNA-binding protein